MVHVCVVQPTMADTIAMHRQSHGSMTIPQHYITPRETFGLVQVIGLRYHAAAGAALWTMVAKAVRACSPRSQRSPPLGHQLWSTGGGGGRSMSTMDLVALGYGCLRPPGGDRCRMAA